MNIGWLCTLLVVLSILHPVLHADIYRGTIGKNLKIIAELSPSDNEDAEYDGRYFYEKYKRDILLSGNLKHLREHSGIAFNSGGENELKDYWQGKFKGDRFIGQWSNAAGTKTLPIRLKKIAERNTC